MAAIIISLKEACLA